MVLYDYLKNTALNMARSQEKLGCVLGRIVFLRAARVAAKELGQVLADVGIETVDRTFREDRDKR